MPGYEKKKTTLFYPEMAKLLCNCYTIITCISTFYWYEYCSFVYRKDDTITPFRAAGTMFFAIGTGESAMGFCPSLCCTDVLLQ